MGRRTSIPVRWKILIAVGSLIMLLVPAPAYAEGTLQVPLVEGAPEVDGVMDEGYWTRAETQTYAFDGTLRPERTRDVTVRLAHNGTHLFLALSFTPGGGTHEADHILVTLHDGDPLAIPAGAGDYLRYGGSTTGSSSDRHWNGTAWVQDRGACSQQGIGARTEHDGTWHYELVKPLSGDACDLDLRPGEPFALRIEVRENMPAPDHGDDFRWPAGSSYLDAAGNKDGRLDEVQGWARYLLETGTAAGTTGTSSAPGQTTNDAEGRHSDGAASSQGTSADGSNGSSPGGADSAKDDAAEAPAHSLFMVVSLVVVAVAGLGRRDRRL